MKQLVIAVLVAALLSLGYRLAGTLTADADSAPPPKQEAPPDPQPIDPIQSAAIRVDRPSAERYEARDDRTGPNRTRRGDEASLRSQAVPRSAAKPLDGANAADLATARTPPAAPPQPRTFGPDGIVYQKLGAATPSVSSARLTPPPAEEPSVSAAPLDHDDKPLSPEPPVVVDDKPSSPEPLPAPQPPIAPAHGRTVSPDGIEFHTVNHAH
jgi:hypothetical protein